MMKVCKSCEQEKSLSDFYTNGKTKGGELKYRPECKECNKEKNRVPEHLKKNKMITDIDDPIFIKCRRMAADAHARVFAPSRQYKTAYRNLDEPFGFTSARQMYEYLYTEFYNEINTLINAGASPSVDRIDSSKGYTPGNIRVISHKENTLRGVENVKKQMRLTTVDGRKLLFESVEDCAWYLGVQAQTIRNWINGTHSPPKKLFKALEKVS
jgi:hypothetical protein